jgi:hypothetical protein
MVLVIGYESDGAIRHSIERFRKIGIAHDFLDLTLIATSKAIELRRVGSGLRLRFDDIEFDLCSYRSIYQRTRFQPLQDPARNRLLRKAVDTLYAFLNHSPQLIVNRPCAGSENHNKFLHLESLRAFGFRAPEQAILGEPRIAAQVLRPDETWVSKGCSAFKTSAAIYGDNLELLVDRLRTCPSLFQERIVGNDVRVHVVGEEVYAVTIECETLDYRFPDSGTRPRFSPADVPGILKLRCIEFARKNRLLFAGFDFKVCGRTGEWFVLEVNPMPGYDMFDRHLNGKLSSALAELLCAAGLRGANEIPAVREPFIAYERRHPIVLSIPGSPSHQQAESQRAAKSGNGDSGAAVPSDFVGRTSSSARAHSQTISGPSYREIEEVVRGLLASGQDQLVDSALGHYWAKGFRPAQSVSDCALEAFHRGDWTTLAGLMDYTLIRSTSLSLPGIGNEDIARAVLSHPKLQVSPAYNATRGGGKRLTELDTLESPLFGAIVIRIRDEIEAYGSALEDRMRHPVALCRPSSWRLYSWALVLDETGFEDWHIHPSGWISGVYYVQVPAPVDGLGNVSSNTGPPGSIQFSRVGPASAAPDEPKTHMPEASQLLLFPSHFWHRTWPTHSAMPRISIAFDAVPVYSRA